MGKNSFAPTLLNLLTAEKSSTGIILNHIYWYPAFYLFIKVYLTYSAMYIFYIFVYITLTYALPEILYIFRNKFSRTYL